MHQRVRGRGIQRECQQVAVRHDAVVRRAAGFGNRGERRRSAGLHIRSGKRDAVDFRDRQFVGRFVVGRDLDCQRAPVPVPVAIQIIRGGRGVNPYWVATVLLFRVAQIANIDRRELIAGFHQNHVSERSHGVVVDQKCRPVDDERAAVHQVGRARRILEQAADRGPGARAVHDAEHVLPAKCRREAVDELQVEPRAVE